jgi:chorismate mutase/prephenate dehydratase
MVLLRIENKPGALVAALEPFKEMHINLTHFATRSARAGDETLFFVQTDGHKSDLQVPELLEALAKNCHELKILGSYPKPLL